MTVELYFFQPLGTNSGRACLALLEKEVPFTWRELNGLEFEHLRPEYLAINPRGQVPALVHDGRPLVEGAPICEYIDEAFAGPPLRPADLGERWS
ncbi:MAG: glutathione S-transferase family protein, partial [Steroidobacteraceae bacterium]